MSTFPWNHLGFGTGVCNTTVKPPFWRHEDNRPFLRHLVDATLLLWCENIRLPHWQTTRCGHGPVYKSISTTGRLMRSCWQSCQSNAPWAALEEVVLLSASKTVQENPLTTINGSETTLDRQTSTSLALRCRPSRCFICLPLLPDWLWRWGHEVGFGKKYFSHYLG